jgi:hypothetical protein
MLAMDLASTASNADTATSRFAEAEESDRWSRARTLTFIGISSTLLWACIGGCVALIF